MKLSSEEFKNMSDEELVKYYNTEAKRLETIEKMKEQEQNKKEPFTKKIGEAFSTTHIQRWYMIMGTVVSIASLFGIIKNIFPSNKEIMDEQKNIKEQVVKSNDKLDTIIVKENYRNVSKETIKENTQRDAEQEKKEVVYVPQPAPVIIKEKQEVVRYVEKESTPITEEVEESSFGKVSKSNKKQALGIKIPGTELNVFGTQKLLDGGILIFRNAEEIILGNDRIERNTKIYANVTFEGNRARLSITDINGIATQGKGFDLDQNLGIPKTEYVKDNYKVYFK